MDKFHINEDGVPGRCTATVQDCRFAVDGEVPAHYPSPELASLAYEQGMAGSMFSTVKKPDKIKPSELNELAKTSSDDKVLLNAAVNGSDRARKALASNENANWDILKTAYDNAKSQTVKDALVKNGRFLTVSLDNDDFKRAVMDYNVRLRTIVHPDINDEQADILINNPIKGSVFDDQYSNTVAVVKFSHDVSPKKRAELMDTNIETQAFSVSHGLYPANKLKELDDRALIRVKNELIPSANYIRDLVDAYDKSDVRKRYQYRYANLAKNDKTPTDVIERIVKSDDLDSSTF